MCGIFGVFVENHVRRIATLIRCVVIEGLAGAFVQDGEQDRHRELKDM